MKNVYIYILFFFISINSFTQDTSNDLVNKQSFCKDFMIKFRGEINWAFAYYFGVQKGISSNHISPINYNILDYTDKDDKHHTPGEKGEKVGHKGYIETMLSVKYSLIFPFFKLNNFLFEDNKIKMNLIFNISPVTFEIGTEMGISPIAFLFLTAGTTIGTGWNISGIANGLARNNYGNVLSNEPEEILIKDSFFGPAMRNWFSLTLQFDFSYLCPKNNERWTHIIMMGKVKLEHILLLNFAYYNKPYEWQADNGETLNGWYLYGDFILGYKLPVIIDKRKEEGEKNNLKELHDIIIFL